MSNKPTLEMLADKRDLILLAEIGALIHDLGKLSAEFVRAKAADGQGDDVHHLFLRRYPPQVPDYLKDHLSPDIEGHHAPPAPWRVKESKYLSILQAPHGVDGLDSGVDKGAVSNAAQQPVARTYIATAFGYEMAPIPVDAITDGLSPVRHRLATVLADTLGKVIAGTARPGAFVALCSRQRKRLSCRLWGRHAARLTT